MRFILVDRILRIERGKEGVFLKNVTQSEDYFADHFPGCPIMPGVLILEGFAQGCQLLIAHSHDFRTYPGMRRLSKVAFKRYVLPGDSLELSVAISRQNGREVWVEARAHAKDKLMAEATMEFELIDGMASGETQDHCRRLESLYQLLSSDPVARAWDSFAQLQASK